MYENRRTCIAVALAFGVIPTLMTSYPETDDLDSATGITRDRQVNGRAVRGDVQAYMACFEPRQINEVLRWQ